MSEKGELDLTGAKQNTGMWLVKVPKYLSQQWTKASGRGEVGKLRIAKNQGRTEVSFTLNEDLASINDIGGKPASVSAPREHPFLLQSVGGQMLTVFTESSVGGVSQPGPNYHYISLPPWNVWKASQRKNLRAAMQVSVGLDCLIHLRNYLHVIKTKGWCPLFAMLANPLLSGGRQPQLPSPAIRESQAKV
nr:general transcription factor IIF subunit 2 isoform X1 [Pelodiscus sinensis]|eukprot:XP_025041088.1 general transcription factor IIF subunit 2 isoform X1 [Pelodiscus sinensis]